MKNGIVAFGIVVSVSLSARAEGPAKSDVTKATPDTASAKADDAKARQLYHDAWDQRRKALAAHKRAEGLFAQALQELQASHETNRAAGRLASDAAALAKDAQKLHAAEGLRGRAFDLRLDANALLERAAFDDARAARLDARALQVRALVPAIKGGPHQAEVDAIERDAAKDTADAKDARAQAAKAREDAAKLVADANAAEKRASSLETPVADAVEVKPFGGVIPPPAVTLAPAPSSSGAAPKR